MPTYDIRWEAQVDQYSTAFTNSNGDVVRQAGTQTPMLDWMSYYIENVHTWVFFEWVSQKYAYAPEYRNIKPSTVCGIQGINHDIREADSSDITGSRNQIGGFKLLNGGSYQAGGHAEGPTFNNGLNAYYARIRNFQIRRRGEDWGPGNPGPGQDGDI
jgi:hypothetical protein